ncbi:MAG: sugar ABC transporter substrate-binding protein [Acidimicrobiia bacterium]|nr:MAG: sugar ABC transporter substrate-binding protein [Acidimicrobiia bacterium]
MTHAKMRPIRLISLFVVLVLIAAACSGTDTTTSAPDAGEALDPTACNLAAPAEATTINYLGWSFAATEFYAAELQKCGETENVEVDIQFLDFTAATDAVRLALATGNDSPYDIIHTTNPEVAEFGGAGWLLPLNDLIDKYSEEYNLDDIPQSAWDGATIDGQIFGVPVIGDSQVIAYRSDLFAEAGIEVPKTYDEIIAACATFAGAEGIDTPFVMDFSAGWAIEIEYLAAIRSFGGDYLAADNSPTFNSPEGVTALTKMKEVNDACMGGAHLAYGYEAGEAGINNGTVVFTSIWATSMDSMSDPEQSEYSAEIKYAPAAAPLEGSLLGGTAWHNYYSIPATTPNDVDLIFRAIMETADEQSQTDGAAFGVVTRLSVTDGVPTLSAVNTTIDEGVGPYDNNPAIALVQVALGETLPFVMTGEMTPQEALDAAAEAYIAEATAQGFIS